MSENPEFLITRETAEERDQPFDGVIIEYDGVGYVEYSKGVRLKTEHGEKAETETAEIDMVIVDPGIPRHGVGSKLLAKVAEEARREGFKYIRASSIHSRYAIKIVERAFAQGLIRGRAYKAQETDQSDFDLPSAEMLSGETTITAEEAIGRIAAQEADPEDVAGVQCVVEL